ncbi:class I SAM-dependent methyltransferase [Methanococcoides vulcani]|uniref:class I SAM-dependent methyltransferase n=1 Tax=Methanococcoides vulcani TaxID=1353158 RepID=UPI000B83621F|nr:class I SAM-dependent methyltransferase [Methanococcoides vulcani]
MTRYVFDNLPQRYDLLQKQALPNWEVFFSTVIEYIPEGKQEILELGSGTGFLTSMIRKARPEVSITCIDKDPDMLAIAKEKPELKDITFVEGDILKMWPETSFDLVISTQCLFALPVDEKARIFKQIHDCLRPGGMLLEGDIFRPESKWEEMIYRSQWKSICWNRVCRLKRLKRCCFLWIGSMKRSIHLRNFGKG